jgi:hypothetical protein
MSTIQVNRIINLAATVGVNTEDLALMPEIKQSFLNLGSSTSNTLIAGVEASKYKAIKVFSHYVSNRDDEVSVAVGWSAMLAQLKDGDTIVFDGMFKVPVQANQLVLENFKNVTLTGGGFYRWVGCSEHMIRFHACEGLVISGMTFLGTDGGFFVWGNQGIYTRDCVNTVIENCKFKDIGDAAIRTCRVTEVYYPPTTVGIIIKNNFFTNCTQVTTSGTGALKYIFTGNVTENMYSLKIARRNTDDTGWHLVYGNHFKGCEMGVELQGANKVKFYGNTVIGKSLVRMYRNDETFGPTWVANKDISIHDNDFISTGNSDCIYINNQNSDISTPTDVAGYIEITNNRMTQNFSGNRGSIFLSSYSGAKLTDRLTIRGNKFLGTEHINLLASQSNNPLSMAGMDLDISENEGNFKGWFVSANIYLDPAVTNGSFICEGNRVSCNGIIDFYVATVIETSPVLKEYIVANNTFKTTGTYQHLKLGFNDRLPMAQHTEIVGNTFKVDSNSGGDMIRFSAPPASRVDEFSYDISDNKFILTGTFTTGPNQPRAMIAPLQSFFTMAAPKNLIAQNNTWVGPNARIPRSDNSLIPFSLRTIIRRSKQGLEARGELVHSSTSTNVSGVTGTIRNTKVYADRTIVMDGIWENAAGNSFNLIFGVPLEDTNYTLTFTPVYTEALAHRIVSKSTTFAVVRCTTLAGTDVSPVYSFTVTGKLSESQMSNYI